MTLEQELEAMKAQIAATESLPTATLGDMNELAARLGALRDSKKELEDKVSELSGELESLQKRLIEIMVENGLATYKAPTGTISVTHHFTARLPQGEEKTKLFDYLKSIGRFEEMASIHSQTFNSWVKEQYELAKERGEEDPVLPGVADVKTLLRISFRRAK